MAYEGEFPRVWGHVSIQSGPAGGAGHDFDADDAVGRVVHGDDAGGHGDDALVVGQLRGLQGAFLDGDLQAVEDADADLRAGQREYRGAGGEGYHVGQFDGTGVVALDHIQAEQAVAAFQRRVCIAYIVGMSTMVQSAYHGQSPPTPAGNSRLGAMAPGKRTMDWGRPAEGGRRLGPFRAIALVSIVADRVRASMAREDAGAYRQWRKSPSRRSAR